MASRFHHCAQKATLAAALGLGLLAASANADEIRLKDGKKLYGVIVGFEDNMFKVKTEFGYVLVEKDKIAQIVPNSPAPAEPAKTNSQVAPAPVPVSPAKNDANPSSAEGAPVVTNAVAKSTTVASAPVKKEKVPVILGNPNARPEVHASAVSLDTSAPALKTSATAPKTSLGATSPPAPPKEEAPVVTEEIRGNVYLNYAYGFRMYKAPSWQMIEGAGQALPNAIMAMGTANESTLLVVGHEKSKGTLESVAKSVEKRMQDVYENYQLISERPTVVGGQNGIEYRYRGKADEHDWSGTLVVVPHGDEFLTIMGMTYADNDLIQIQENVISRSIASVQFAAAAK